jgi:DNA primase
VLFDGDAAGLRASIRGIDLILEEGMNVKVCTFPQGEDPDSFARKNSYDELVRYLDANAKDFIQFKASLLMDESQNDPVKKASLIRDMVTSISKIPDRIQREIYLQETARIMDISEQVLVNTLAQLIQKDVADTGKKQKQEQKEKAFEVVKNENPEQARRIDVLYELERKIIEILLLYGNMTEEFEDVILRANAEGEIEEATEKKEYKVYQRIYLSLQEDEVELANPLFRDIYNDMVNYFHQNESFNTEHYLMHLAPELAQEVTDILMYEEREVLHNWEGQNIIVKQKDQTVGQYVSETILTLRWYLVDRIIEELKGSITSGPDSDNTETLSMAMDYYKLINSFSSKLGRVMSRYS